VVTLAGQVRFPGPYELLPGETVSELLAYAGWSLPDGEIDKVELVRYEKDGTTSQRLLDIGRQGATELANGDRVRVPSVVENRQSILVTGALFGAPVATDKPVQIPPQPISVNFPFAPGLTLLGVLEALGGPTPYAKAREGLIVRKRTGERVSVDMEAMWASRDRGADIALEPGDTVSIPIANEVFVLGEVRSPGRVPFNQVFNVADYLFMAGGINPLTADPNGLYFLDKTGARTRTGLTATVAPGALLFVDKNAWTKTQKVLGDITVVAVFITTVAAAVSDVISAVNSLR
jgi:protein involved in polysaccharide export with SLBB domain